MLFFINEINCVVLLRALNLLPESSPVTKRIFKGFNMVNATASTETEGKSLQSACFKLKCRMMSIFGDTQTSG